MDIVEHKGTTQVTAPTWNGSGFDEELPDGFWSELPEKLRAISIAECLAGNSVDCILKNLERGIVLIRLSNPPASSAEFGSDIRIHSEHQYGNYCYDGTVCTYEHLQSGCFIAFEDSSYVPEAY